MQREISTTEAAARIDAQKWREIADDLVVALSALIKDVGVPTSAQGFINRAEADAALENYHELIAEEKED